MRRLSLGSGTTLGARVQGTRTRSTIAALCPATASALVRNAHFGRAGYYALPIVEQLDVPLITLDSFTATTSASIRLATPSGASITSNYQGARLHLVLRRADATESARPRLPAGQTVRTHRPRRACFQQLHYEARAAGRPTSRCASCSPPISASARAFLTPSKRSARFSTK